MGNTDYIRSDYKEKMGAALCRILLEHVVPSMGGLENCSKTVNQLERYVANNHLLFDSYKRVIYAILKKVLSAGRAFES